MKIKSQSLVQFFGAGNNGAWGGRIRTAEGAERFIGQGAGYTMQQAQAAMSNNRALSADYETLREGVKAKA